MSHSSTGGVKSFSIAGRMAFERERLTNMTDEERRWRAQYLKDQILAPEEPKFVPELHKATNNIFKRTGRYPMDVFQSVIGSMLGRDRAAKTRYLISKCLLGLGIVYMGTYYFKYHGLDWTNYRGMYLLTIPPCKLPGDPGYPNVPKKEKHEYYDVKFSESPFF